MSQRFSLLKGKNVLDCGCGIGRWGYILRKHKYLVVGFDIYKPYLKQARTIKAYFGLIQADISCLPFSHKTFDTSLAIEVIEHTTKKNGYAFIEELKRVTKKRVILTTPQNLRHLFFGHDHPETHKSAWTKEELESLGFQCTFINHPIGKWLFCIYNFHFE